MRVRLVSESLWGGTGRVISWLASRLAEDGHAVTLVLRSREGTDWYTPAARVTISREFSLYGWRSPMPSTGAHLSSFTAYARQLVLGGLRSLSRPPPPVLLVGVREDPLFQE